jgi:hypothetical protein
MGYNFGLGNFFFLRNFENNDHRDAEIFRTKYLSDLTGDFYYKKPSKDLEMKSLFE